MKQRRLRLSRNRRPFAGVFLSRTSPLGSGGNTQSLQVEIGKQGIEGKPEAEDQNIWKNDLHQEGTINAQENTKGKDSGPGEGHDAIDPNEERVFPDVGPYGFFCIVICKGLHADKRRA
jgi:hypothetical protein